MRFRSLLAACVLPLAATGAVYGCSNAPAPEDLCGWLQNPNSVNCVSHFHEDLKDQCGAAYPATVSGTFSSRAMLDMCVLTGKGGSVTFDPPIALGAPPTGMPMTMHFTNADGTNCGEVAYTSTYSWSIKLVAPESEGAGGSTGVTTGGGGQSGGPSYSQGMIAVTRVGGDTIQVSCPAPDVHSATELVTPELHTFNLNQVLSSTVKDGCPQYAEIIPQAIFEVDPGGIGRDGAMRLKIQYPPQATKSATSGAGGAGGAGAGGASSETPASVAPNTTYYFDCVIPGAKQICANGVKDASEVDVDCGGRESKPMCPVRCTVGQLCIDDCDCDATTLCEIAKDGTKRCTADPAVPVPQKGVCSQIICANQVKDGSESDVDCGGLCDLKCAEGQKCGQSSDCAGNSCTLGICGPPTCTDKAANGNETDVDCGGPMCPKCADGQKCNSGDDCTSKGCFKKAGDIVGVCSPCADDVKNGNETDVDCGGDKCAPCGESKTCKKNSDCATNICNNGVCNSCSDGMKDGKETDVDCGGPVCGKCDDGKVCTASSDCKINGCLNGVCSQCGDNKQNGTESDIDCGGTVCAKCGPGKVCVTVADCAVGTCDNNRCGSCTDGMKGYSESDVDCGGDCGGCAEGKVCFKNEDCAEKYCDFPPPPATSTSTTATGSTPVAGVCNTCNNQVMDGTETALNCGGATCPKCDMGKSCTVNLDCKSGICINKLCK